MHGSLNAWIPQILVHPFVQFLLPVCVDANENFKSCCHFGGDTCKLVTKNHLLKKMNLSTSLNSSVLRYVPLHGKS